jgi:rifampicin phosphotransferase
MECPFSAHGLLQDVGDFRLLVIDRSVSALHGLCQIKAYVCYGWNAAFIPPLTMDHWSYSVRIRACLRALSPRRRKLCAGGSRGEAWTLPLATLTRGHLSEAGGKAVTLGAMHQAGLPVPPGFVITVAGLRRFIEAVPAWGSISADLKHWDGPEEAATLSGRIHDAFSGSKIPDVIAQAVWRELDQACGVQFWAVRSSAIAEDSAMASFAGQHESFLNVSRNEILSRVRDCWTSLFSPRALLYRARKGASHQPAAMAVIIQRMVSAERAGVLFTADPVSGDSNRLVIEGGFGLGDQIASGHVAPDRVVLTKPGFETIDETKGGVLDAKMARRLAELSGRIEKLLGGPLDIEWAICRDEIQLLQARPITSATPLRTWEDRQVWSNVNTGEVLPDVTTPVTWSILQLLFEPLLRSVFSVLGADIDLAPEVGLVAGRVYININTVLAALRPFSFLLDRIPNIAQALGGGQALGDQRGLLKMPRSDLPDLGFTWTRYLLGWPRILSALIAHSPRRGDAWTLRLKARMDDRTRMDMEGLSTSELIQFVTRSVREEFDGWDLLYLATQASALPVFQWACHNWLGDPHLALGCRLFSGLGGVPEAEAGLALWGLALLAHGHAHTETIVSSTASWPLVRPALEQTGHGREFLAGWAEFMAVHGHHCRGELELFNPRWSETPDYILALVRGYLRSIDQSNLVDNQRRVAAERLQLQDECCRRLKNPIKRWLFSRSLSRAQKLAVNREKWKNEAVRQIAHLRRLLVLIGQRLHQQGILSEPNDIFFLDLGELEPVATGKAGAGIRDRIRSRRQEYELNKTLTPPPLVTGKFRPLPAEAPPEANASVLRGIPVSPGIASGRARVILRSDDHEHVLRGEILVAPFTDPAWTPYFIGAAGVVTDQGGLLSHGSIVAREYGLPAVTNLVSATRLIHTGDMLHVDGNQGSVQILERARPL